MRNSGRTIAALCGIAGLAAGALAAPQAMAQGADFYAGKSMTMLIGAAPGGGYDVYARTIIRHLGRFIPGSPEIVPRTMVGAGSATAAAAMYTTAPKDGTWIGAIFPGVIIGPILEPKTTSLFDPTKFIYLGSADSGTRVCITGINSKVKTFKDAQQQKTIMGASAAGGSTRDYSHMLNHVAGAKFEIVSGYKGSADIFLGVPFNIASYSLLLMMVAQVTGYRAGRFIHTMGDVHLYRNHVDAYFIQRDRTILPPPTVKLNPEIRSIFDFNIFIF